MSYPQAVQMQEELWRKHKQLYLTVQTNDNWRVVKAADYLNRKRGGNENTN